jgi:hypothetical protein
MLLVFTSYSVFGNKAITSAFEPVIMLFVQNFFLKISLFETVQMEKFRVQTAYRARKQPRTPNTGPRSITANLDVWGRLTRQLLGRLKSTIPNQEIYSPKRANSEKLGLGIDKYSCRIIFFQGLRMIKCLERVNDRHFWNWSLLLRNVNKMSPQLKIF